MADVVLQRRVYHAGDRIFREGDIANNAYIVESGEIEIFRGRAGEEVVIGTVSKGGIFGEMALIDNAPRMAGAQARTQSSVIVVTKAAFEKKLDAADPLLRGLLKIFVNQIRALSEPGKRGPEGGEPPPAAPTPDGPDKGD